MVFFLQIPLICPPTSFGRQSVASPYNSAHRTKKRQSQDLVKLMRIEMGAGHQICLFDQEAGEYLTIKATDTAFIRGRRRTFQEKMYGKSFLNMMQTESRCDFR